MKEGIGHDWRSEAKDAPVASPETASYDEECELCGSRMYGLHCKLVCPNCGYKRDCSDP